MFSHVSGRPALCREDAQRGEITVNFTSPVSHGAAFVKRIENTRKEFEGVVGARDKTIVELRAELAALRNQLSTSSTAITQLRAELSAPRDRRVHFETYRNHLLATELALEYGEKDERSRASPAALAPPAEPPAPRPRLSIPRMQYPDVFSRIGFAEYVCTLYIRNSRLNESEYSAFVKQGRVNEYFLNTCMTALYMHPKIQRIFIADHFIRVRNTLDYFFWKIAALNVAVEFCNVLSTHTVMKTMSLRKGYTRRIGRILFDQFCSAGEMFIACVLENLDAYCNVEPEFEEYTKNVDYFDYSPKTQNARDFTLTTENQFFKSYTQ